MAVIDRRRIDVQMDSEMERIVNKLINETNLTQAEILQQALKVYAKVKHETMTGGRVILQDNQGKLRELANL